MADIHNFPKKKVFKRTVHGHEVWAQQEPPEEMVWEVCPYTRSSKTDDYRCHHCPRYEDDPKYGQVMRGCFGMASLRFRIQRASWAILFL